MDGFGERLKLLRKGHDLTQGELAEQIGVVPSAVSKLERVPNAYPSVEALIKIADVFHVSIDYLLRGVEPTPLVENNISGQLSNSPFIQANHGGVVFNGEKALSPEAIELMHIFEALNVRDRLKLLNFAVELEGSTT